MSDELVPAVSVSGSGDPEEAAAGARLGMDADISALLGTLVLDGAFFLLCLLAWALKECAPAPPAPPARNASAAATTKRQEKMDKLRALADAQGIQLKLPPAPRFPLPFQCVLDCLFAPLPRPGEETGPLASKYDGVVFLRFLRLTAVLASYLFILDALLLAPLYVAAYRQGHSEKASLVSAPSMASFAKNDSRLWVVLAVTVGPVLLLFYLYYTALTLQAQQGSYNSSNALVSIRDKRVLQISGLPADVRPKDVVRYLTALQPSLGPHDVAFCNLIYEYAQVEQLNRRWQSVMNRLERHVLLHGTDHSASTAAAAAAAAAAEGTGGAGGAAEATEGSGAGVEVGVGVGVEEGGWRRQRAGGLGEQSAVDEEDPPAVPAAPPVLRLLRFEVPPSLLPTAQVRGWLAELSELHRHIKQAKKAVIREKVCVGYAFVGLHSAEMAGRVILAHRARAGLMTAPISSISASFQQTRHALRRSLLQLLAGGKRGSRQRADSGEQVEHEEDEDEQRGAAPEAARAQDTLEAAEDTEDEADSTPLLRKSPARPAAAAASSSSSSSSSSSFTSSSSSPPSPSSSSSSSSSSLLTARSSASSVGDLPSPSLSSSPSSSSSSSPLLDRHGQKLHTNLWTITQAPRSDDIQWKNLAYTGTLGWLRWFVINSLLFAIVVFVAVPSLILHGLRHILATQDKLQQGTWQDSLIAFASTYSTTLIMYTVNGWYGPYVIGHAVQQERWPSLSLQQISFFKKQVWFGAISNVLLPLLGLNTVLELTYSLHSPSHHSWAKSIGDRMFVSSGLYYMQYLIHAILVGSGLSLLDLHNWLVHKWRARDAVTPLEQARARAPLALKLDQAYASVTVNLCFILLFSTLSPLLMLFAALYAYSQLVVYEYFVRHDTVQFFRDSGALPLAVAHIFILWVAATCFVFSGICFIQPDERFLAPGFVLLSLVVLLCVYYSQVAWTAVRLPLDLSMLSLADMLRQATKKEAEPANTPAQDEAASKESKAALSKSESSDFVYRHPLSYSLQRTQTDVAAPSWRGV